MKNCITRKYWRFIVFVMTAMTFAALIMCMSGCSKDQDEEIDMGDIYEGVYVADLDLGGMSVTEAEKAIGEKYKEFEYNPILKCEDVYIDIYSSRIELKPNIKKTAELAASYGKKGSASQNKQTRKSLKTKPVHLDIVFDCNLDILQYELNEKLSDYIVDVQEYTVEMGTDCLIVTNGKPGRGVEAAKVVTLISKSYTNNTLDRAIEIEITDIYPEKINADEFCDEYSREPKDAVCVEEGGDVNITPEVVGIRIDEKQAKEIIAQNVNNKESYKIPAEIIQPKVTAKQLEAEFTDTVIASYSTDYSTSSDNRKENIRLAASKINGKILNPGEVFSFNNIVGPRTEATGFKVAHVYSGNKVVDGIGGGICQVSSTLYNAVVFADLEIVYRTNHSIPVSYVPLGRDATVSYGTIDFKFKNNKETPVKIAVVADGNILTVNVYARAKYQKDISIETVVTGTVPFSVSTIEDDAMYEGERVVEETGANGTTTEAYKIIKENGVVVSRTLLCKSSYSPVTQVERVGTKKKEPAPVQPQPQPTNPPSGSGTAPQPPVSEIPPHQEDIQSVAPPAQTDDGYYNEFDPIQQNSAVQ